MTTAQSADDAAPQGKGRCWEGRSSKAAGRGQTCLAPFMVAAICCRATAGPEAAYQPPAAHDRLLARAHMGTALFLLGG